MGARVVNRMMVALKGSGSTAGHWLLAAGRPVALPLTLLALYAAGVWCLWQFAASRSACPTAAEADARRCPWLAAADVAAINEAARLPAGATMFERDVCRRVAEAYAGNPWVEQVVSVQRRFPDRFEIALAIRQPVACVGRGGRYYLVDRYGCRLPTPETPRPAAGYPLIDGIATPPPAPGEVWSDECLADALRLGGVLSSLFEAHAPRMRLASIEARRQARRYAGENRPDLRAWTTSGVEIDWGSYNESSTYFFPSAGEKREALERQLVKLPDPAAVGLISVRYRPAYVRPRSGGGAVMVDSTTLGMAP